MSSLGRRLLKWLIARQVAAGRHQKRRLVWLYREIHAVCQQEFYEDDDVRALENYLHEAFMLTQSEPAAGAHHHEHNEHRRLLSRAPWAV